MPLSKICTLPLGSTVAWCWCETSGKPYFHSSLAPALSMRPTRLLLRQEKRISPLGVTSRALPCVHSVRRSRGQMGSRTGSQELPEVDATHLLARRVHLDDVV